MKFPVQILPYGEQGVLINWPEVIEEQISKELLSVKIYLKSVFGDQLLDASNGYNSILLFFKIGVTPAKIRAIKLALRNFNAFDEIIKIKIWEIPVCYDISLGSDLQNYLEEKELKLEELIQLHSQPEYHVYCKGFLPGFLYLGGLDKKLYLDRKTTPSLKVPKNAVAIGGKQTGIYPSESPGGWHIIGQTPNNLIQWNQDSGSQIKAGDKVRFNPISKKEFQKLKQ